MIRSKQNQNRISLSLLILGGVLLILGLIYDYQTVKQAQAVAVTNPISSQNFDTSQPTFRGKAEVGNTVELAINGQYITTVEPDAQGDWSYTLPANQQLVCSSSQQLFSATEYGDQIYQMNGQNLIGQAFEDPISLSQSNLSLTGYQDYSQGFSYPGSDRIYLVNSTGSGAELRYIDMTTQTLSNPVDLGSDRVLPAGYIQSNYTYTYGRSYPPLSPDGSKLYLFTENTTNGQAELLVIDYDTADVVDQISLDRGPDQVNYSYDIGISPDGDFIYYYDYDSPSNQYLIDKADTTNYSLVGSYQLDNLYPSYAYYVNGELGVSNNGDRLYLSLVDDGGNQSYIQAIDTKTMNLVSSLAVGSAGNGYLVSLFYNPYSDQVDTFYIDLNNPDQMYLGKHNPNDLSLLSATNFAVHSSHFSIGSVNSYASDWVAYLGYDDQDPTDIPFVSFYNLQTGGIYKVDSAVFSQADFSSNRYLYTLYTSTNGKYLYLGNLKESTSSLRLGSLEAFDLTGSIPESIGSVSNLITSNASPVAGIYRYNIDNITTNFSYRCPITEVPNYDLSLSKDSDKSTYLKSEDIVYKIRVTNIGDTGIDQIRITDNLPPGLVTSTANISCSLPPGISQSHCQVELIGDSQISVSLNQASLEPGRYIELTIKADIEVAAASFVNKASVISNKTETNTVNNFDTASVYITDYQPSNQTSNTNNSSLDSSTNSSSSQSSDSANSSTSTSASQSNTITEASNTISQASAIESSLSTQASDNNQQSVSQTSQLSQVSSLPDAGSKAWWVFYLGLVMFVVGLTMTNQLNALIAKAGYRGVIGIISFLRLKLIKINDIKIV
ncbi:hypothetical protein H6792_03310 [Candidatus Nomurabacteria bacterium]|nr:hypothetical protein [Candidatus Nomurabacteria bacterium]